MLSRIIDLTGETFGRLRVVERAPDDEFGMVCWTCVCTCGETMVLRLGQLFSGLFITCGKPSCQIRTKAHSPKEAASRCWEWLDAPSGYNKCVRPSHSFLHLTSTKITVAKNCRHTEPSQPASTLGGDSKTIRRIIRGGAKESRLEN